jgi:hypothetical protein
LPRPREAARALTISFDRPSPQRTTFFRRACHAVKLIDPWMKSTANPAFSELQFRHPPANPTGNQQVAVQADLCLAWQASCSSMPRHARSAHINYTLARRKVMSHACRGTRAFAHNIIGASQSVLNCTTSTTATVLLFGLVMAAAPNVASAQGPTKVETPLIDTYVNPCTGESVNVTGTTDLFIYMKVKSNGSTDFTLRIKHRGTGVSLATGASYHFHSEESTKFSDVPPGAFDSAMLTKTMLVREGSLDGSADDWMFKNTIRLKIDEFGNVLVNREKIIDTCVQ